MTIYDKTDQAEAHASAFFHAIDRADTPVFDYKIQPIRSLSNMGFVWVIGITSIILTIPLWPLFGTKVLWGLLPHLLLTLALLWYFIRRNDMDRSVYEHIKLWPDLMTVHRYNPRTKDQYWQANPYWVRLKMRDTHTHQNYLTLTGGAREIELASFLSPEERVDLRYKIEQALKNL